MDLNKLEIRGRESGAFTIVDKRLTLSAFEKTDWFHHPTDEFRKSNVLALAMPVREERFTFKARVSVTSNHHMTRARFLSKWTRKTGQSWASNTPATVSQRSLASLREPHPTTAMDLTILAPTPGLEFTATRTPWRFTFPKMANTGAFFAGLRSPVSRRDH